MGTPIRFGLLFGGGWWVEVKYEFVLRMLVKPLGEKVTKINNQGVSRQL